MREKERESLFKRRWAEQSGEGDIPWEGGGRERERDRERKWGRQRNERGVGGQGGKFEHSRGFVWFLPHVTVVLFCH